MRIQSTEFEESDAYDDVAGAGGPVDEQIAGEAKLDAAHGCHDDLGARRQRREGGQAGAEGDVPAEKR